MNVYHTDKTLVQQLQIGDKEVNEIKDLFDICENDYKVLKEIKVIIEPQLDGIIDSYYNELLNKPGVDLIIGDKETLDRLRNYMRKYVQDTFSGNYSLDYVNSRLRIGKIHQRIGVSPKLYMSALRLLESLIVDQIVVYLTQNKREKELALFIQTLSKIFLFDAQFIFDTYIAAINNEVITAKNELEAYADSLEDQVHERTQELELLSKKDMLTGLYNQRAFYDILYKEVARAERYRHHISLVYFDVNDFKQLNDTLGHQAGDAILSYIGKVLEEICRESDIPCRYGGDEFCIILTETSTDEALKLLERLIERFIKEDTKGTSLSIGFVTQGPDNFISVDDFVKKADTTMYKAKKESKKTKPALNKIVAG